MPEFIDELKDALEDLRDGIRRTVGERDEVLHRRIDEMQAKMDKPNLPSGERGGEAIRQIAKTLNENREQLKKFGTLNFEVPDSISKGVYSTSNAAPFVVPGITDGARPGSPFQLRSMLPFISVNSGSAWRIVETGLTSNVAQRAEGDTSNESTITIAGQTVPMISFSSYVTLSEEALDDIDRLVEYLNRTMAFSLASKIDAYLLGEIRTNATTYNANAIVGFSPTNGIERMVVGAGQLETAGYMPGVAVVNPAFRRALGLIKASGSGDYMFGPPTLGAAERVSDLALIGSGAQAAANFTVLAPDKCIVYERSGAKVLMGRINDDFTKHLYRLRVSERLAIAKTADGVAVNGDFS